MLVGHLPADLEIWLVLDRLTHHTHVIEQVGESYRFHQPMHGTCWEHRTWTGWAPAARAARWKLSRRWCG